MSDITVKDTNTWKSEATNMWITRVDLSDGKVITGENYKRIDAVFDARDKVKEHVDAVREKNAKEKTAVIGYRKLSDTEIALMNKIKTKGAELGELVAELQSIDDLDQRAIAIGKTEVQTGLMWLVRGVAQPESF